MSWFDLNSKGVGQLIVIGVVLLIVFGLLFVVFTQPELAGGIVPFEVVGGTPSNVLVPRIGAIWCQASDSPLKVDYLRKENFFYDYERIEGLTPNVEYTANDLLSRNGYVWVESYACSGYKCEFNISPDNFDCFDASSDAQPIFDVYIDNQRVFSRKVKIVGGTNYLSFINEYYSGSVIENHSLMVKATCVAKPVGFYSLKSEKFKKMSVPVNVFTKRLVWKAEGTEIPISSTEGCTYQDVLSAINKASASQPKDKEFNLWGWWGKDNLEEESLVLDNARALNVGDVIKVVYEWRQIPAFGNVRQLSDGSWVVSTLGNDVYRVKNIALESGQSIWVASDVYKRNVECISNEECVLRNGFGWQCSDDFECFVGARTCSVPAQCGTDNFWEENGKFYFQYWDCVNGECVEIKEQKVCHPDRSYPMNGCPIDKPICVNGDECVVDVPPIVDCPSECCLAGSSRYRPRDCPEGKACETSGGFVGICVSKPDSVECGDKFCDLDRGETYLNCPADCPQPIVPVGEEFDWLPVIVAVVIIVVALIVGFVYVKK